MAKMLPTCLPTAASDTASVRAIAALEWPEAMRARTSRSRAESAASGSRRDYRHPGGTKISTAVVRHLATDPARRLGSLFINGGAPPSRSRASWAFTRAFPR